MAGGEPEAERSGLIRHAGNVFTWCQESYRSILKETKSATTRRRSVIIDPRSRVLRGGTSCILRCSCVRPSVIASCPRPGTPSSVFVWRGLYPLGLERLYGHLSKGGKDRTDSPALCADFRRRRYLSMAYPTVHIGRPACPARQRYSNRFEESWRTWRPTGIGYLSGSRTGPIATLNDLATP